MHNIASDASTFFTAFIIDSSKSALNFRHSVQVHLSMFHLFLIILELTERDPRYSTDMDRL